MHALSSGRGRAARILLERGARADLVTSGGFSAITCLMHSMRPMGWCATEEQAVRALLGTGAPAHGGLDRDGLCPAFVAAQRNHTEALRLLLGAPGGADAVRVRDPSTGKTALHHARELLAGAAPYPPGAHLRPPASNVRLLLERGADANAADNEGRVPALLAVLSGSAPALALLLDAAPPADPSWADGAGVTLLMHAARAGAGAGCLLPLLGRGADARASLTRDEADGGGQDSAADVVLDAHQATLRPGGESGLWPSPALAEAMSALLRAGAPVSPRHAPLVLRLARTSLRPALVAARELAARRADSRRRAIGHGDVAGLASDLLELHGARAAVARARARLSQLGAGSIGRGVAEEEAGTSEDEDGASE